MKSVPIPASRYYANLDRLCGDLERFAEAGGLPAKPSALATKLSEGLFLAHSTSDAKFAHICQEDGLLSPERLAAAGGLLLRPDCAEVLLGTHQSVFFYVAPFRFPNTGCGLLFSRTLEVESSSTGAATPFDSGGLVHKVNRPNPTEPVREFFARHELPVPDHRRHLGLGMSALFGQPEHYIEGHEPTSPSPMGLTGGDERRWTHEVRIPDRVPVRSGHLEAVFAPKARIAKEPAIEALFDWCQRENVDREALDTPRENDFEGLQRACLAYIRRRLY